MSEAAREGERGAVQAAEEAARRALRRARLYLRRGEKEAAIIELEEARFYLEREGLLEQASSIRRIIESLAGE